MTEIYTPKNRSDVFRFNDVVEFLFTFLPEEDRIGRLVQVRKGCGQFGSDVYFIRRANGVLITGENCRLQHSTKDISVDAADTTMVEYSIRGKYPEVGFVVEAPRQRGGLVLRSTLQGISRTGTLSRIYGT